MSLGFKRLRPCHGSGGQSPASYPGLDPGVSPCEFLVGKVTLWQVSIPVLRFSHVSIIPPMLHTHLYLNITVIRRTSGRSLGSLRKHGSFGYQGACGLQSTLSFSDFKGLVVLAPYRPVVTVYIAWLTSDGMCVVHLFDSSDGQGIPRFFLQLPDYILAHSSTFRR